MRIVTATDTLLFPVEPAFPPGFSYQRNFLTLDDERKLLAGIEGLTLRNAEYHEYTALRRTASFSLGHDDRGADPELPPPAPYFLIELAARVARACRLPIGMFPRALVTEYPPGAPIGWHRDAPPYAVIYGESLLSGCEFRLRPQREELRTRANTLQFTVEPRSLYVMSGESRSQWQHSIAPVKATRYSITLRTLGKPFP